VFLIKYFGCKLTFLILFIIINYLQFINHYSGGGWACVRRQENSSFANIGRVSVCAICKCAYRAIAFYFFSIGKHFILFVSVF